MNRDMFDMFNNLFFNFEALNWREDRERGILLTELDKPQVIASPNIYQDDNSVYVDIAIAGYSPDLVKVEIEDSCLIVNVKAVPKEDKKYAQICTGLPLKGWKWKINSLSSFCEIEQTTVEIKHGLLKLVLPKKKKTSKQISINY